MRLETKVFLKIPSIFIFTGNTNIAKKLFIENGYMFKTKTITADEEKRFLQLLLVKFSILLIFIFATIPVKVMTIFFKEKEIWIMNTDFVGPYLKQEGDPEYFLINECNDSGLHFL